MICHEQFELASCQASIFTPDEGLAVARLLSDFLPSVSSLFDAEPVVLPAFPPGAPPEIPRILLKSRNECWSCDIAPARVNLYWRRQGGDQQPEIPVADFYSRSVTILRSFRATIPATVNRMAAVLIRFCACDAPGIALASHFCDGRWLTAPLNRPENFELHAHKRFMMAQEFEVNSWARSKTALLAEGESPIIAFEQDINTVAEASSARQFGDDELARFFSAVTSEFQTIVNSYFPGRK